MTVAHVLGRFNAAGGGTFHYRPLRTVWLSQSALLFRVEAAAPGTRALAGTNLCNGELAVIFDHEWIGVMALFRVKPTSVD